MLPSEHRVSVSVCYGHSILFPGKCVSLHIAQLACCWCFINNNNNNNNVVVIICTDIEGAEALWKYAYMMTWGFRVCIR